MVVLWCPFTDSWRNPQEVTVTRWKRRHVKSQNGLVPSCWFWSHISKRIAVKLSFSTGWKHSVQIGKTEYTNWGKKYECYTIYRFGGKWQRSIDLQSSGKARIVLWNIGIYVNDVMLSGVS